MRLNDGTIDKVHYEEAMIKKRDGRPAEPFTWDFRGQSFSCDINSNREAPPYCAALPAQRRPNLRDQITIALWPDFHSECLTAVDKNDSNPPPFTMVLSSVFMIRQPNQTTSPCGVGMGPPA